MIGVERIGNKLDVQIFGSGSDLLSEFGVLAAALLRKPKVSEELLINIVRAAASEDVSKYQTEKLRLFSRRLSHVLEVRGLRAKDLAEELGIPKETMLAYLSGSSHPAVDILETMAKRLDVTPDYLLGGD